MFVQWMAKNNDIKPDEMTPEEKKKVRDSRILPMIRYIERIQGPHAELYKKELTMIQAKLKVGKREKKASDDGKD